MLSQYSFQAVAKITRKIITTSKHQKRIHYKQCITSENLFAKHLMLSENLLQTALIPSEQKVE